MNVVGDGSADVEQGMEAEDGEVKDVSDVADEEAAEQMGM